MDAIQKHLEEIAILGYTLVEDVLSPAELDATRKHMDALQQAEVDHYGREKLIELRELGTLRFMMARDRYFLDLINLPAILKMMDALLGSACIVHLQNGIILLSSAQHQQASFHQDYRRWMNGFNLSYNAFFLIDDFTAENGGTYVVPATHILEEKPSDEYLASHAIQITGKAGTILVFNSRLWHRGGENLTDKPRRAINTQYTASYLRQQVDYAHCLPEEDYATLPERVQQLLGRFVRMPKSLDEFRVDPADRLYRSGQG